MELKEVNWWLIEFLEREIKLNEYGGGRWLKGL